MVEKDVECSFNQPKGASSGNNNVNLDPSRRHKRRKTRTKNVDESESLSDIDDVEVRGYLHSKKEMQYKRILWEAMNKEHTRVGPRKRARKTKEATASTKATAKQTKASENKEGRSSKINYDALKKLTDELQQESGELKVGGKGLQEAETNSCSEREESNEYNEDADTFFGYGDDLYSGYEDGYDNNYDYEDLI